MRSSMLLPLLLNLVAACGSSTEVPAAPDAATHDATSSDVTTRPPPDALDDSATDGGVDAPPSAVEVGATDAPASTESAVADAALPTCASTCAKLTGKVHRQPSTKPTNGGKGNLYIAVFDHDPITDKANAKVVGQAMIPAADFTADTAEVAYEVDTLAPRGTPYSIIAFLDDNHNVSSTAPAPDKGDLVSLNGLSAPTVSIPTTAPVSFDLTLNLAMPF